MSLYVSKKEFDNQFEKYMRNNKNEFEIIIKGTLETLENATKISFLRNDRAINECIEIYRKILKDYKCFYEYLLELGGIYKILPVEKDYYLKKWYEHFKKTRRI